MRARKWVALGAILATMLTASLAFGETPTPCYEAYRPSTLSQQQQTTFEEFRDFYGDDLCTPRGSSERIDQ
jgi:hypothetical protein